MDNFDLEEILIKENLELIDGVWYSKNSEELSYPQSWYDECYSVEDKSFWFRHRNNCIVKSVKRFSPNCRILDVGGGNGFVSLGLANEGIHPILVEPAIQGALNAKKRGLKDIVCSSLDAGLKDKNQIPAIGIFDVLEHIDDDDKFLLRLKDFLTYNGLLYITVPLRV